MMVIIIKESNWVWHWQLSILYFNKTMLKVANIYFIMIIIMIMIMKINMIIIMIK